MFAQCFWLAAICACSAMLSRSTTAQIPWDEILILERPRAQFSPSMRYISSTNPRIAARPLVQQRVFIPFEELAIDREDPGRIFFTSSGTSLGGIWEARLDGPRWTGATWGLYKSAKQPRQIESGKGVVYYTSPEGLFEIVALGATKRLFALPEAQALERVGDELWFASQQGLTSELYKFDLVSRQATRVASFPAFRTMSATGRLLVAGGDTGEILWIDRPSGRLSRRMKVSNARIVAVSASAGGAVTWTDGTRVWSTLRPQTPVYTSATAVVDLAIGRSRHRSVLPFGQGCPGSNRKVPQCTWKSVPRLGARFEVGLRDALASSAALLGLGVDRDRFAALRTNLPFDLSAVGMANCWLHVDPAIFGAAPTSSGGTASQVLSVPNNPALKGQKLYLQWFVVDSAANRTGLITSDAILFAAD